MAKLTVPPAPAYLQLHRVPDDPAKPDGDFHEAVLVEWRGRPKLEQGKLRLDDLLEWKDKPDGTFDVSHPTAGALGLSEAEVEAFGVVAKVIQRVIEARARAKAEKVCADGGLTLE